MNHDLPAMDYKGEGQQVLVWGFPDPLMVRLGLSRNRSSVKQIVLSAVKVQEAKKKKCIFFYLIFIHDYTVSYRS